MSDSKFDLEGSEKVAELAKDFFGQPYIKEYLDDLSLTSGAMAELAHKSGMNKEELEELSEEFSKKVRELWI